MIKVIIFDLDDTLYNEMQFVKGGFYAVASYISQRCETSLNEIYKLLITTLDKQGRGKVFDICLKILNVYEEKIISQLVDIYRMHKPQLELFPEVNDVLNKLKNNGHKLGLITDGDVRVQESKVRALRIERLFDCIIFSRKYGIKQEKPNTFVYYKALEVLGVSAECAVYIGDNPHKDFAGAKKMGIITIRIVRGQHKGVKLAKKYEADFQILTLSEIFSVLNKLRQKI